MIRHMLAPALILVALGTPATGHAAFVLTISAPTADLSNLTVGEVVDFEVKMSGLPAGARLEYLAAQVTFPVALFGSPTIAKGAVAPDVDAWLGTIFPDAVDGNYDILFATGPNPDIVSDGVFFTFTLEALSAGSGELAFTPGSVFSIGFSAEGDPIDSVTEGDSLAFTIRSSGPNAVPVPAALTLALTGLASLVGYGWVRRPAPAA